MVTSHTDSATRTRAAKVLLLSTLSLTVFLIAIDASILNIALPHIAEDLQPNATELLWVVDAYSLTVAALLITTAALGDRFGRRRMLRLGLVVFGAGLVLAAVSPSALTLIGARVILGVGGALAMPATLAILRTALRNDRERAFAVGVWSAVGAAGFVLGPLLGGAVLNNATWPFVFWLQLPLVAASLLMTVKVPESRSPSEVRIDPLGVVLSAAGLTALASAAKEVGKDGALDLVNGVLLLVAVASLTLFTLQQLRRPSPMVDVRLFRSMRFSGSTIAVLACNMALAAPLLLLTQQFQIVEGMSPLGAGLNFLPLAIAAIIAGPLTPRLVALVGINGAVAAAFTITAVGLALLGQTTGSTPYALLLSASLLIGAGVAVAASAASAALLAAAPAARAGNAAAVQETAYELGLTLGVSIFGSIALGVYRSELLVPADVDANAAAIARDGLPQAASIGTQEPELLAAAVDAFSVSYSAALTTAAAVSLVVALVAAFALPRDRVAAAHDQ